MWTANFWQKPSCGDQNLVSASVRSIHLVCTARVTSRCHQIKELTNLNETAPVANELRG